MSTTLLVIFMRLVVAIGAVLGLGMCFFSSVHGDWPIAMISAAIYAFSLVMLS